MPRWRANSATCAMSTRRSVGLVGVSIQIMRVCGCTAFTRFSCCVRSTKLMSRFADRRRTRSNTRNVPPYRSFIATMWLPESISSSSVLVVAMPDANAKPCVPLSRSAMQRSYAPRVGLAVRA
jgi:hypothetical protein